MGTKPTHEQAQLHLQVYDLRREARLRQARDWFRQSLAIWMTLRETGGLVVEDAGKPEDGIPEAARPGRA